MLLPTKANMLPIQLTSRYDSNMTNPGWSSPPLQRVLVSLTLLIWASCAATMEAKVAPQQRPYVLVLGTAQDAGLPQIGCDCDRCQTARESPQTRRLVTSLLLVDPTAGTRYLLDASPDLPEQVELSKAHPREYEGAIVNGARPQLFDGIFLTHAHMGHYSGLLQLGREAYGTQGQLIVGTPRLSSFFSESAPWKQMLRDGTFRMETLPSGQLYSLSGDLSIQAIGVPHRDEYSDTVCFIVKTSQASLAYLPDIDKWSVWGEDQIESLIRSVDYALLDGTFFEDGEIPGRSIDEIPHPFITESMERFAALAEVDRNKVFFTHFNHTNPVSTPGSEAAKQVFTAGYGLAREGMIFEL